MRDLYRYLLLFASMSNRNTSRGRIAGPQMKSISTTPILRFPWKKTMGIAARWEKGIMDGTNMIRGCRKGEDEKCGCLICSSLFYITDLSFGCFGPANTQL
jgi:hypothetical protein